MPGSVGRTQKEPGRICQSLICQGLDVQPICMERRKATVAVKPRKPWRGPSQVMHLPQGRSAPTGAKLQRELKHLVQSYITYGQTRWSFVRAASCDGSTHLA